MNVILKQLVITAMFTLLLCTMAFNQTGYYIAELKNVDSVIIKEMGDWDIPGASVAICKDGRLVYARGFGYADLGTGELVQPHHLFRIASVSKPITSIAMMKLCEDGYLELDDKVFGVDGILNDPPYSDFRDETVGEITVRHLLHHTSGWGGTYDPMLRNQLMAERMGQPPPVGPQTIIKCMLMYEALTAPPGSSYIYSNF